MTVRELREILCNKPPLVSDEEFDNMEIVGLTNNGIEQMLEDGDNEVGVQMIEVGRDFTFVFAIPLETFNDEEDFIPEDKNALPKLIFLAESDSEVNFN
jgi:hypothetical protein